MSQITVIDSEFSTQYSNVIQNLNIIENKFFRDVPPNIIISLYNVIYLTNTLRFSRKCYGKN